MNRQETNEDVLILAIESSCDETAASVVKNGREVLSNVISRRNLRNHSAIKGVEGNLGRNHIG